MGTNITNNLTSLKFSSITMAIQKNLCLASCLFYLFLERNEFIEAPFINLVIIFIGKDKNIDLTKCNNLY